jgi:hypothetical protein
LTLNPNNYFSTVFAINDKYYAERLLRRTAFFSLRLRDDTGSGEPFDFVACASIIMKELNQPYSEILKMNGKEFQMFYSVAKILFKKSLKEPSL